VPAGKFNSEMIDTSNKSDMKMGKKNIRSFLKSITPGERGMVEGWRVETNPDKE
jgi:hypothetical protein